ncbi:asparagine synthetase B [Enterobacter cloacae]|nr:asparagine synthetase B [Enterobacter cloacae]
MRINPQDKMCGNGKMEKHILRECFESYLPASVAWRQKEQFSDGVGYSWIDTLKEVAAKQVFDRICTVRSLRSCSRFQVQPSAYRVVHRSPALLLKPLNGMNPSKP